MNNKLIKKVIKSKDRDLCQLDLILKSNKFV